MLHKAVRMDFNSTHSHCGVPTVFIRMFVSYLTTLNCTFVIYVYYNKMNVIKLIKNKCVSCIMLIHVHSSTTDPGWGRGAAAPAGGPRLLFPGPLWPALTPGVPTSQASVPRDIISPPSPGSSRGLHPTRRAVNTSLVPNIHTHT